MWNAAKETAHKLSMKLKSFKKMNEPKENWGKEIIKYMKVVENKDAIEMTKLTSLKVGSLTKF